MTSKEKKFSTTLYAMENNIASTTQIAADNKKLNSFIAEVLLKVLYFPKWSTPFPTGFVKSLPFKLKSNHQ